MATNQDIVSGVATAVGTVTNIGNVHAYQRFNVDWANYLAQFAATISGTKQIRGWIVSLADANPIVGVEDAPARFGSLARIYNVRITGIQDLKDSSNTEQTLLNLCETVMDTLDAKTDLSIAAVIDYGVGPCSLTSYEIRQFGSTLCHVGEILCPVLVQKDVIYA